jgi:hypothetical protein
MEKKDKINTVKGNKYSLYSKWKEVMFNPELFFSSLESKSRYQEASKYFLKVQAIVTGLFLLMMLIMINLSDRGSPELLGVSASALLLFSLLLLLILYPLFLLIAWGMLYVNTGISHVLVILFGGKQGYVETYKVMAYSVSPSVFTIIPFVNWVSWIYVLVLQIIGIKERQKLNWAKSIAVIVIPMAIVISILIAVYVLFLRYLIATGGII